MKDETGKMKRAETRNPEDLKTRTKRFALKIIALYASLPKTTEAQVLGKQVLRSGTSVGAHYRESICGRSNAEVVSKLEVGLHELEETRYWLELLAESGIMENERLSSLDQEADELAAIFVSCVRKIKGRSK
jgi:four helix bundle protein